MGPAYYSHLAKLTCSVAYVDTTAVTVTVTVTTRKPIRETRIPLQRRANHTIVRPYVYTEEQYRGTVTRQSLDVNS